MVDITLKKLGHGGQNFKGTRAGWTELYHQKSSLGTRAWLIELCHPKLNGLDD